MGQIEPCATAAGRTLLDDLELEAHHWILNGGSVGADSGVHRFLLVGIITKSPLAILSGAQLS